LKALAQRRQKPLSELVRRQVVELLEEDRIDASL
jgi:hypothetical protein